MTAVDKLKEIVLAEFGAGAWNTAGELCVLINDIVKHGRPLMNYRHAIAGSWIDKQERCQESWRIRPDLPTGERFEFHLELIDRVITETDKTTGSAQSSEATHQPQVGTILAEMNREKYGFTLCGGCASTLAKMNSWGYEKCREEIDTLAEEMKSNATHQPLFELAKALPDVARHGGPIGFAKWLIELACQKAEEVANAGHSS